MNKLKYYHTSDKQDWGTPQLYFPTPKNGGVFLIYFDRIMAYKPNADMVEILSSEFAKLTAKDEAK